MMVVVVVRTKWASPTDLVGSLSIHTRHRRSQPTDIVGYGNDGQGSGGANETGVTCGHRG